MDDEYCYECKILIDPNEMGGECCNFCNMTVCAKCYDERHSGEYYGYVCSKCEK